MIILSNGKGRKGGKRKVGVTVIGSGGCGSEIVCTSAIRLSNKTKLENDFDFRWYLHDLSREIYERAEKIYKETNGKLKPLIFKPTILDPGAGGVPLCAEMIFFESSKGSDEESIQRVRTASEEEMDKGPSKGSDEETFKELRSFNEISKSSLNVYVNSLGGGTGSRTTSLLIQKMKEKPGGIADIAICVLTDIENENLNHIYTFPDINKSADMVILLENGTIIENEIGTEEFINEKAVEVIHLFISSRLPDTYPRKFDPLNYLNHISRYTSYNEKKRWLVPFIYPAEGYDKTEYKEEPLLTFIDKAFDTASSIEGRKEYILCKRCLCKVEEKNIKECESCILFVKAPEEYIHTFKKKVREVDKKKIRELDLLLLGLENKLKLGREDIFYTFIPEEEGFKICLLLQNIPLLKLKKLNEYLKVGDIEKTKRGWKDGVERGIKNMISDNLIVSSQVEEIRKKYQKSSDDLTKEFKNLYGNIT